MTFHDEKGPHVVSAMVSAARPLSAAERTRQRGLVRRRLAESAPPKTVPLRLVSSILVGERRYDTWWTREVLEGARPPETRPLLVFLAHVRAADAVYTSLYAGPPFPAEGIESLPPEQAAERLAAVDARAYDARGRALEPYRRRAAARPDRASLEYELALMIWFHHFFGFPGPVEEAEPPLRRALAIGSRSPERLGLLGEVRLRAGRSRKAGRAFEEAARLRPGHPRYHYCASVACASAGEAEAARRHLARARKVAGPRLKHRFTRASNPLEDHRLALIHEVGRLRERYEGLVRESDREHAERCRSENENEVRASRVPRHLRPLVPLAAKWGIGDDGARGYLARRATREDKEELRRAIHDHAARVSAWLDTVLPDHPSPESGAFLYLLEACEEMGLG